MRDAFPRLAQYLDDLPARYPATEGRVEIEILENLFTEEESEMAHHLTLLRLVRIIMRSVFDRALAPRKEESGCYFRELSEF